MMSGWSGAAFQGKKELLVALGLNLPGYADHIIIASPAPGSLNCLATWYKREERAEFCLGPDLEEDFTSIATIGRR